jgi:hypothetical protein
MTKPPPGIHACKPDEIVPAALREYLRWDHRHDSAAQQVMADYGFKLPQNRELIRQLTFVRVQQGEPPAEPAEPSAPLSPAPDSDPAPDLAEFVRYYGVWTRMPAEQWATYTPEQQETMKRAGVYSLVSAEEWREWDRLNAEWQARRRAGLAPPPKVRR